MALRVRDVQPAAGTPQNTGRGPRGPVGLIAGVIALVVLAVLITWLLMRDPTGPSGEGEAGGEPAAREIPAGLEQGEASADFTLATEQLHGVPRGFPQTVPGAVEAASAMAEATKFLSAERPSDEREDLLVELLPPEAVTPELETVLVERARDRYGLTEEGQPIGGQPGDQFVNECLPEFGLYRVTGTEPAAGETPRLVEMEIWMPCVQGTGSSQNIDALRLDWGVTYNAVEWRDGDWSITDERGQQDLDPLIPAEELFPNVSVEERAELVADRGEGWMLYQGWSEEWPTEVLGEEPS